MRFFDSLSLCFRSTALQPQAAPSEENKNTGNQGTTSIHPSMQDASRRGLHDSHAQPSGVGTGRVGSTSPVSSMTNPWLEEVPGEIADERPGRSGGARGNALRDRDHEQDEEDDLETEPVHYGNDHRHNGSSSGGHYTGFNKRSSDNPAEEGLNDARRFEDFETIDWIQDTLFERARRQRELRTAQKKRQERRPPSSRFASSASDGSFASKFSSEQLQDWYTTILHATQSWLVVTLVGALIGLNAALVDIITSWLTDLKFGYCRVSWWLNSKFCCWEIDPLPSSLEATLEGATESLCEDWREWSDIFTGLGYLVYVFYAVLFAFSAAFLVRSFAPYAAGSGISEVKCILAGFIMKGFLGAMVLIIKSLTLVSEFRWCLLARSCK